MDTYQEASREENYESYKWFLEELGYWAKFFTFQEKFPYKHQQQAVKNMLSMMARIDQGNGRIEMFELDIFGLIKIWNQHAYDMIKEYNSESKDSDSNSEHMQMIESIYYKENVTKDMKKEFTEYFFAQVDDNFIDEVVVCQNSEQGYFHEQYHLNDSHAVMINLLTGMSSVDFVKKLIDEGKINFYDDVYA